MSRIRDQYDLERWLRSVRIPRAAAAWSAVRGWMGWESDVLRALQDDGIDRWEYSHDVEQALAWLPSWQAPRTDRGEPGIWERERARLSLVLHEQRVAIVRGLLAWHTVETVRAQVIEHVRLLLKVQHRDGCRGCRCDIRITEEDVMREMRMRVEVSAQAILCAAMEDAS